MMLRRRGTYTVNADPDDRHNRAKSAEPSPIVVNKNGMVRSLVTICYDVYVPSSSHDNLKYILITIVTFVICN